MSESDQTDPGTSETLHLHSESNLCWIFVNELICRAGLGLYIFVIVTDGSWSRDGS